jgi:hypothetical protein
MDFDPRLHEAALAGRQVPRQDLRGVDREYGLHFTILHMKMRLVVTIGVEKVHSDYQAEEHRDDWHRNSQGVVRLCCGGPAPSQDARCFDPDCISSKRLAPFSRAEPVDEVRPGSALRAVGHAAPNVGSRFARRPARGRMPGAACRRSGTGRDAPEHSTDPPVPGTPR